MATILSTHQSMGELRVMAKNNLGLILLGLGLFYLVSKKPKSPYPSTIGQGLGGVYIPLPYPAGYFNIDAALPETPKEVEDVVINGNGRRPGYYAGLRSGVTPAVYPKTIGTGAPIVHKLTTPINQSIAEMQAMLAQAR